jgi:hypothetical protein
MVALVEDFDGPGAAGSDPLGRRRFVESPERLERPREVPRAALEVVRARDATHCAVASRSATTAGETYARMLGQEASGVETCMWTESHQ